MMCQRFAPDRGVACIMCPSSLPARAPLAPRMGTSAKRHPTACVDAVMVSRSAGWSEELKVWHSCKQQPSTAIPGWEGLGAGVDSRGCDSSRWSQKLWTAPRILYSTRSLGVCVPFAVLPVAFRSSRSLSVSRRFKHHTGAPRDACPRAAPCTRPDTAPPRELGFPRVHAFPARSCAGGRAPHRCHCSNSCRGLPRARPLAYCMPGPRARVRGGIPACILDA